MSRTRPLGRAWQALLLLMVLFALPTSAHASWSISTTTLPSAIVTGISCPTTTVCVQVQSTGKSQSTANGGATWTLSANDVPGAVYGLDCPSTTLCFATSGNEIYRSTNLGGSWTQVFTGAVATNGVDCPSTSICYVVGAGGRIAKTTDGGSNWVLGVSQTASALYGVSCPSTTVCFANAAAGAIMRKRAASDTWDEVSPSTARADMISPYNNGLSCPSLMVCYAGGTSGTIAKTADGGTTWNDLTSGTAPDTYAMSCSSETRCIAVGVAQGSMFTDDGGATWSEPATGSASAMYAVTWVSGTVAMAGSATGKVYLYQAPGLPYANVAVSQTLTAGTLSFIDSTPGNVTFPTRALTNADQTVTATQPLVVNDASGSGAGWSIAVTSTTFTTGSRTLSNAATSVATAPTIACKAGSTCTTASNNVSYPFALPAGSPAPTAQTLFRSAAGSGLGAQTITPTWSLAIPATAYSGTYTSTWTFTLTSGP